MEVTGILKAKMDTKQVSDKFKSREFVLTTDPGSKYPQTVVFQLTQDKCNIIDSYNVGEELKLQVNVRGREWANPQGEIKYFNTLEAWKVERVGASTYSSSAPAQSSQAAPAAQVSSSTFVASTQDEDLPF